MQNLQRKGLIRLASWDEDNSASVREETHCCFKNLPEADATIVLVRSYQLSASGFLFERAQSKTEESLYRKCNGRRDTRAASTGDRNVSFLYKATLLCFFSENCRVTATRISGFSSVTLLRSVLLFLEKSCEFSTFFLDEIFIRPRLDNLSFLQHNNIVCYL